MKKVNIVFIGECIIIALLLIVLGVLLKSNSSNSFAKNITKETEIVEEMGGNQENVDDSATGVLPSIVNAINDDEAAQNETEVVKSLQDKKIVVFGDSIWNAARGEDGISEYIQQVTGATVYNCAIGGTTAALVGGENSMENWTSNCFNGMIYVARKLVPAEKVLGDNTVVLDIIKQVDFAEMDYVIVSYGLNDFFCDELVVGGECKRWFVTLGQFSIVRLERDSQLLIPSYDFCMPSKECAATDSASDNACDLFRQIKFPVEQFFPPNCSEALSDSDSHSNCRCK